MNLKKLYATNYINIALDGFKRMKPFQDFLTQAIEDVEDGSGIL